jgi:hypothetical protein
MVARSPELTSESDRPSQSSTDGASLWVVALIVFGLMGIGGPVIGILIFVYFALT